MMRLFTYDELDAMRNGKTWWHVATKRYDAARGQATGFMMFKGEDDPNECECPDEVISDYCLEHGLWFDKDGNIWFVCDPCEEGVM